MTMMTWLGPLSPPQAAAAAAVGAAVAGWLRGLPGRARTAVFGERHEVDEAELLATVQEMKAELQAVRPGQVWARTRGNTTAMVKTVLDGQVRLFDTARNGIVTARLLADDRIAGYRLLRDAPRPAAAGWGHRPTGRERRHADWAGW